jgi:hypothetical protein
MTALASPTPLWSLPGQGAGDYDWRRAYLARWRCGRCCASPSGLTSALTVTRWCFALYLTGVIVSGVRPSPRPPPPSPLTHPLVRAPRRTIGAPPQPQAAISAT